MSHDVDRPLRVIGIGSPFGDDTVGWQAVERLRKETDIFPHGTEWHTLDRPGSALIPLLENSKAVVLIDAMQSGLPHGTVQRLQLSELLMQAQPPSSHSFGVAESLAMAEALNGLPEKLLLYGVEMGATPEAWYPLLLQQLSNDLSEIQRE